MDMDDNLSIKAMRYPDQQQEMYIESEDSRRIATLFLISN